MRSSFASHGVSMRCACTFGKEDRAQRHDEVRAPTHATNFWTGFVTWLLSFLRSDDGSRPHISSVTKHHFKTISYNTLAHAHTVKYSGAEPGSSLSCLCACTHALPVIELLELLAVLASPGGCVSVAAPAVQGIITAPGLEAAPPRRLSQHVQHTSQEHGMKNQANLRPNESDRCIHAKYTSQDGGSLAIGHAVRR